MKSNNSPTYLWSRLLTLREVNFCDDNVSSGKGLQMNQILSNINKEENQDKRDSSRSSRYIVVLSDDSR